MDEKTEKSGSLSQDLISFQEETCFQFVEQRVKKSSTAKGQRQLMFVLICQSTRPTQRAECRSNFLGKHHDFCREFNEDSNLRVKLPRRASV